MKRLVSVCCIAAIVLMFTSLSPAKMKMPSPPGQNPAPPTQPPPAEGDGVINACYKNVNGQLRIVGDPSQCLPSESAISWNATGLQGPSGVVATSVLSGAVEAIAGGATAWVFAGPTASVMTTESQRITGVAEAPLGTTATDSAASFLYDLCYRAGGSSDVPVSFAGANSSVGQVSAATGRLPFPAAGSIVPGAGTWEVGFCVLNSGSAALDMNDFLNGWVMVTE